MSNELGRWAGFAEPLGPNPKDFLTPKSDEEVVRFCIRACLLTNPGERVMVPDYGIGILHMIHEQQDAVLVQQIKARVTENAKRYQEYFEIHDVQVTSDPAQKQMIVLVYYSIPQTDEPSADWRVLDVSLGQLQTGV